MRNAFILSLSFDDKIVSTEEVFSTIKNLCSPRERDIDLVVLPEYWDSEFPENDNYNENESENYNENENSIINNKIDNTLSSIAKDYDIYILSPRYIKCNKDEYRNDINNKKGRKNVAQLFDRNGDIVYQFVKSYPFWTEIDTYIPEDYKDYFYDTDFGRISVNICFDANFSLAWERNMMKYVDIVLWPSVYSGGRTLSALSSLYHFNIVTATKSGSVDGWDNVGDRIYGEVMETSSNIHSKLFTIDVDATVFHYDFNKTFLHKFYKENNWVQLLKDLPDEKWFVLSSTDINFRIREECKKYGLVHIQRYLKLSDELINNKIKTNIDINDLNERIGDKFVRLNENV